METFDPGAFFAFEMLGSTLGAAGGGIGGFFLGLFLCFGSTDSYSLACIAGGAMGYLIGTPIGATVGVSIVGHLHNVQGNLLLSFLGASLGEGAGILTISALGNIGLENTDAGAPLFFFGVPLLSGLGATLGYNVDAIVKSTKAPVAP